MIKLKDIIPEYYLKEDENPCWKGYEMIGTKMKNGKEVPNCVPIKEYRIRGNADNLVIRKGDIKKGMMVWFEDGKGSAKKLKVKHVMLSKDKKEEHYITNKGTFTPRDVVGY